MYLRLKWMLTILGCNLIKWGYYILLHNVLRKTRCPAMKISHSLSHISLIGHPQTQEFSSLVHVFTSFSHLTYSFSLQNHSFIAHQYFQQHTSQNAWYQFYECEGCLGDCSSFGLGILMFNVKCKSDPLTRNTLAVKVWIYLIF